ncbi:MAG: SRPBCC domain-containing protein [Caulobacteraceae bacterium]|nr:SRPBCC domain-containing protein [Caulobacteraceae bacterium]
MSLIDTTLPPLSALLPHRLEMERAFDAPHALVWAAWTRPEMRVCWMGPVEWPMLSGTNDLRPGGLWRACLGSITTDDVIWQGGMYREVVEPERLVFTFRWDESQEEGPPAETLVTVLLHELPNGRTRMEFTQEGLKSEASLDSHAGGWASTFDRLASWLPTQTPGTGL